MREWWLNLSLRDKQLFILSCTAIAIFLIYFFIWSPLLDSIATLRTQLQRNQATLAWMKTADKEIQLVEKNPAATASQSSASLLSIVQNEINQSTFAKNVSQLHQAENDAVQLSFQQIDFDQLITWLMQLWQQHHIAVTQATIKKSEAAGSVTADISLKMVSS